MVIYAPNLLVVSVIWSLHLSLKNALLVQVWVQVCTVTASIPPCAVAWKRCTESYHLFISLGKLIVKLSKNKLFIQMKRLISIYSNEMIREGVDK